MQRQTLTSVLAPPDLRKFRDPSGGGGGGQTRRGGGGGQTRGIPLIGAHGIDSVSSKQSIKKLSCASKQEDNRKTPLKPIIFVEVFMW